MAVNHLRKHIDEDENLRFVEVKAGRDWALLKDFKGQVFAYGNGRTFKKKKTVSKSRSRSQKKGLKIASKKGPIQKTAVPKPKDDETKNIFSKIKLRSKHGEHVIIEEVICGANHCLALDGQNNMYGWGSSGSGELGVNFKKDFKLETATEINMQLMMSNLGSNLLVVDEK